MPSAKMEKQGKTVAVNSNRSPDGWDYEKKDLLLGDPHDPLSARYLFELYENTMSSLSKEDIIKKHIESDCYNKK